MILESIASIAGIIGVSLQAYDKFKPGAKTETAQAMVALKALSTTGKTWKKVHSKYHAVERNLGTLLSRIETSQNGQRITLRPDEVLPNHIKQALEDLNWQDYIENMERELRPCIETLKYANEVAKVDKDTIVVGLRKKGLYELAENVNTIIISQKKVVQVHLEFISFLRKAKELVDNDAWGKEQVEFIIANRVLLRTRIPSVIGSTDSALMAILDLYNYVIDEA